MTRYDYVYTEELLEDICCSPIHLEKENAGLPLDAVMTDALNLYWCENCQHRGEFINWGAAHGYPALNVETYAIGEGAYLWWTAATLGIDDMILIFLGYIEMIDEEIA